MSKRRKTVVALLFGGFIFLLWFHRGRWIPLHQRFLQPLRNKLSHKMTVFSNSSEVHTPIQPISAETLDILNNLSRLHVYRSKVFNDLLSQRADVHDARKRVIQQVTYTPSNYTKSSTVKVIYAELPSFVNKAYLNRGTAPFHEAGCAVANCALTTDPQDLPRAHAVFFQPKYARRLKDDAVLLDRRLNSSQIWVLFERESPLVTVHLQRYEGLVNWTISYRSTATIPDFYNTVFVQWTTPDNAKYHQASVSLTKNKDKKVAWVASNWRPNSDRDQYALQLAKYIQVDIYGRRGADMRCPTSSSSDPRMYLTRGEACFDALGHQYKFYLAFENAYCSEYITEKFYRNALMYNMVPIVRGAPKQDYERVSPPHSFIHTGDFKSAEHLATYLHQLDVDDTSYNAYFEWKKSWLPLRLEYHVTLCRLCTLLHGADEAGARRSWYDNLEEWFHGKNTCQQSNRTGSRIQQLNRTGSEIHI